MSSFDQYEKMFFVLGKTGAICAFALLILVIASFIAALVTNSQAVGYIRRRLTYHVNSYSAIDDSINTIEAVQSDYQCCGVNSWFDYATSSLATAGGTGIGTGIGTGVGTGIGTGVGTGTGNGNGVSK